MAIDELRQYASDREWFIPVLLSECDVPARSIGAGETLLDINWVPLYEDWDDGIQRILSVIKPIPPEIQNLITALRSKDAEVRISAVEALGNMGSEAKVAVPTLINISKTRINLLSRLLRGRWGKSVLILRPPCPPSSKRSKIKIKEFATELQRPWENSAQKLSLLYRP